MKAEVGGLGVIEFATPHELWGRLSAAYPKNDEADWLAACGNVSMIEELPTNHRQFLIAESLLAVSLGNAMNLIELVRLRPSMAGRYAEHWIAGTRILADTMRRRLSRRTMRTLLGEQWQRQQP